MATTSLSTFINETRRFLNDWPAADALTASVTSVATTLSVIDATVFAKNFRVEVDQEVMYVTTTGTGTAVPVRRADVGTTATTHASGAVTLLRPSFYAIDLITAINSAIDETFPLIYKPVLDTTLTTAADTYEYTVPNMPGTYDGGTIPIPYISRIELKYSGELDYREIRSWTVKRGVTPKIVFRRQQTPSSTIRVHGFGPYPDLVTTLDSIDAQFPNQAKAAIPVGAASYLLMSGEAGRVRVDTLANDDREQANRVGSSMSAAQGLYQRFRRMIDQAAMAPMPRHCKSTF
jgi:hypothetical protein